MSAEFHEPPVERHFHPARLGPRPRRPAPRPRQPGTRLRPVRDARVVTDLAGVPGRPEPAVTAATRRPHHRPGHRPAMVRALVPFVRRWPLLSARQLTEAVVAVVLLLCLTPVLLVVACAVKASSPGPVLFRQERLGLHRRPFELLKFRTMLHGSSDHIHRRYVERLLAEDEPPHGGESGVYKLTADPRVTRVGRFLRRTSLDEVPQLWNVVRGELSLVGPRPVLAWEAELFPASAAPRFQVRPGLTGLWQVSGRNATDYRTALDLDVRYARTKSFWLDLWILVRTVKVVLGRTVAR